MMRTRWQPCFVLAAGLLAVTAGVHAGDADYSGDDECIRCHKPEAKALRFSVHGGVTDRTDKGEGFLCESCHGPGDSHSRSEGEAWILAFTQHEDTVARADNCSSCHAGARHGAQFRSSDHMDGGVACSDCHTVHGSDRAAAAGGDAACATCHVEISAHNQLDERHRVHEQIVGCADCHQQHGPSTRTQLGGFKQELCFRCHTDKQGPYLYEHVAVRVEGCESCHTAHGAVNRHMLSYQRVADLCYSCHAGVPGFHTRFTADSQCTNCHVSIHGSNLDEAFLR